MSFEDRTHFVPDRHDLSAEADAEPLDYEDLRYFACEIHYIVYTYVPLNFDLILN